MKTPCGLALFRADMRFSFLRFGYLAFLQSPLVNEKRNRFPLLFHPTQTRPAIHRSTSRIRAASGRISSSRSSRSLGLGLPICPASHVMDIRFDPLVWKCGVLGSLLSRPHRGLYACGSLGFGQKVGRKSLCSVLGGGGHARLGNDSA